MTTGLLTINDSSVALKPIGGVVLFTDATAHALYTQIIRKAARAAGLAALLQRAVDTGDTDQLVLMEAAASELSEELLDLANAAGQMRVGKTA